MTDTRLLIVSTFSTQYGIKLDTDDIEILSNPREAVTLFTVGNNKFYFNRRYGRSFIVQQTFNV